MAERGQGADPVCVVLVDEAGGSPFPGLVPVASGELARRALDSLAGALLRRVKDWLATISDSEPLVLEMPRDSGRLSSLPEGTVVLVRPALVRLGPAHARDLLDDLGAGCNVVIGPTLAGGWYLLALSGEARELIEAAGDGGPASTGALIAAARDRKGLEVGLLRAERDLTGEADLLAAVADPMVDVELSRLLGDVAAGLSPAG